jgi:hypothetical protein
MVRLVTPIVSAVLGHSDLAFALRQLIKHRVYATAIASMSLGIAATTGVYWEMGSVWILA